MFEDKSRCRFSFFFQIFLGVSIGVGIIAGLLTLCIFYLGLFVLGRYSRLVRSHILDTFCLSLLINVEADDNRELKQRGRRRLRKRHLKSEFTLPQTLSRLFHLL